LQRGCVCGCGCGWAVWVAVGGCVLGGRGGGGRTQQGVDVCRVCM
jgi:hypothetical protein